MKIDLNLTITSIIALSAIISPIITALIDNYYKTKRENIQNYELAKRQALINFIGLATKCHTYNTIVNIIEYQTALNSLYAYFKDVPCEINKLGNIDSTQFDTALNNITIELSKQIKQK